MTIKPTDIPFFTDKRARALEIDLEVLHHTEVAKVLIQFIREIEIEHTEEEDFDGMVYVLQELTRRLNNARTSGVEGSTISSWDHIYASLLEDPSHD